MLKLYALMQIAIYLGYKEIYLLGFDHSYTYELQKNGTIVKTDIENAHFFKDEVPKKVIANIQGLDIAYKAFKEYADSHGITVKNSSRGGKLEVFERINFDSLF